MQISSFEGTQSHFPIEYANAEARTIGSIIRSPDIEINSKCPPIEQSQTVTHSKH